MADQKVVSLGPLERRAARTISQGALFDLVQDMARIVDTIPAQFAVMNSKLDTLLEMQNARS